MGFRAVTVALLRASNTHSPLNLTQQSVCQVCNFCLLWIGWVYLLQALSSKYENSDKFTTSLGKLK